MKTLATIRLEQSDYEERLRRLLEESGVDPHEFESLDWFGLLPFYALAGASVRTEAHAHGDDVHFMGVTIEIPEELEEAFYATLPEYLEQAFGEE